jgi:hypothetical protein
MTSSRRDNGICCTRPATVARNPPQGRGPLTQHPPVALGDWGTHSRVGGRFEPACRTACALARCRTHHAHFGEQPLRSPDTPGIAVGTEASGFPGPGVSCFCPTLAAAAAIASQARRWSQSVGIGVWTVKRRSDVDQRGVRTLMTPPPPGTGNSATRWDSSHPRTRRGATSTPRSVETLARDRGHENDDHQAELWRD